MRLLIRILLLAAFSFGNFAAAAKASDVRNFDCVGMNHEQAVQTFSLSIALDSSEPAIGVVWKNSGVISGRLETVTFVRDAASAESTSNRTVYLTIEGVKYRAELLGVTRDNLSVRMHTVAGSGASQAGLEADCKLSDGPVAASMIKTDDPIDKPADQMLGWTRIRSSIQFQCSFIDEKAAPWSGSLTLSPNPAGTISDFAQFETGGNVFEGEPANLASRSVDGQRVIAGLLTFKNGTSQFLVSARISGPLGWLNVVKPQNSPADIPYGDGVCRILEAQG